MEEQSGSLGRTVALVRRVVAARGYAIPRHDREDIAQEAMLQIWRALSSPTGRRIERLDGFASTVAHRCCLAWIRRRRQIEQIPADLADPSPSAEDTLMRSESRALGLRVIRELPERCREILRLHAFRNLTYREIGRLLNRSEHGLRTQMFECLSEARGILERLRRESRAAGREETV